MHNLGICSRQIFKDAAPFSLIQYIHSPFLEMHNKGAVALMDTGFPHEDAHMRKGVPSAQLVECRSHDRKVAD